MKNKHDWISIYAYMLQKIYIEEYIWVWEVLYDSILETYWFFIKLC